MSLPFCEVILGVGVDIVLIYKRECITVYVSFLGYN